MGLPTLHYTPFLNQNITFIFTFGKQSLILTLHFKTNSKKSAPFSVALFKQDQHAFYYALEHTHTPFFLLGVSNLQIVISNSLRVKQIILSPYRASITCLHEHYKQYILVA